MKCGRSHLHAAGTGHEGVNLGAELPLSIVSVRSIRLTVLDLKWNDLRYSGAPLAALLCADPTRRAAINKLVLCFSCDNKNVRAQETQVLLADLLHLTMRALFFSVKIHRLQCSWRWCSFDVMS